MGRVILLLSMFFVSAITRGEVMSEYLGLSLGDYVENQPIKKIDIQNTLSEGYLCFRDKNGLVSMNFDATGEYSRFMSIAFFVDRDTKPELRCVQKEDIQSITVADFPCLCKNTEKCLLNDGFNELKTRFKNRRLYSKTLQDGEKCFSVKDEFEGNYSFWGEYSKQLRVELVDENGSLSSAILSTVENTKPLKTFKSLSCESP